LHADRTLVARAHAPADQFLPAERLGTAVLLDHAILDLLDVLAAGVALAAAKAFATPADAVAFLALARVDDLVAEVAAERTLHGAVASSGPLPALPSFTSGRIRPNDSPSRAMKVSPRIV